MRHSITSIARAMYLYLYYFVAFAIHPTYAYDPITDMCARWDHQSVVKNNILYIDGGTETFNQNSGKGKNVLGVNKFLIEVPLSESWDWKKNISETAIPKDANPQTGSTPPSLLRGAMYQGSSNDPNVYIYGGTTSQLNNSFSGTYPDPSTYSLWSYSTDDNSWDQYDVTSASPLRPSRGSYAEAPDQGLGFYLNGQIDKGSSTVTTSMGNDTLGLDGMIVLNLTDTNKSGRNLSTSSVYPDSGAVSGALTYVPEVGDRGILVGMGGAQRSISQPEETNGTLISFESINIFDIATIYNSQDGSWYRQNTSGQTPEPRIDFCVVSVAAPDNSSHNLYLYGGRDPIQGVMYDDMYILSMPSFIWIQMYKGESPRFGHTCHLIANRQLLTVGGSGSLNITKGCDWENKGVGIMDLSTKTWGSVYNAHAAPYTLTQDIVDKVGGTISGGATLKAPVGGFSDVKLGNIFFPPPKPSPSATSSPSAPSASSVSKKKTNAGAIAGGVIGGLAGVAIIGALAFFLLIRRRPAAQAPPAYTEHAPERDVEPVHELSGKNDYSELSTKQEYSELPGQTTHYELPAGTKSHGNSRSHTRQNSNSEAGSGDVSRDDSRTEVDSRTELEGRSVHSRND